MNLPLRLSADAIVRERRVGEEREPLIVVDQAFAAPDALVDHAARQRFTRIGPYFPGVRAALDERRKGALADAVSPIARDYFGVAPQAWSFDCFFSIVTTEPRKLAPIQRFPHFDGMEEDRLAILVYLCDPKHGGTAFFRHRSTGFETVGRDRFPDYKRALERDAQTHGLPPARYITDGAPIFERIEHIDAAFNRMLIYRGKALHCSAIADQCAFLADPRAGRLTLNGFLQPAPMPQGATP